MQHLAPTRPGRRTTLAALLVAAAGVPALIGAEPVHAAGNTKPVVRIVQPEAPTGSRVPVRTGDVFTARATDSDGRVVRVEWFFRSAAFDYPVDREEPLGISRSAPFRLQFTSPARLYLGGSLVARAYDDRGGTAEYAIAVALQGSAGSVPTAVRFALPYISEAETGSARQSAGTTVLPAPSGAGATAPIRGFSGLGAVELQAPGAFVQWAAKTSQGGSSDQAIPAGAYTFTWRYNNPGTTTRPLRLTTARAGVLDEQPGAVDRGLISFAPTAPATGQVGWRTVTTTVRLPAGITNIRLTTAGGSGPRLDSLVVAPAQ